MMGPQQESRGGKQATHVEELIVHQGKDLYALNYKEESYGWSQGLYKCF